MKKYVRVILGSKSIYAEDCFKGNFIGADYKIHEDLTRKLPEICRDFNAQYRNIWLEKHPEKSKIAARNVQN